MKHLSSIQPSTVMSAGLLSGAFHFWCGIGLWAKRSEFLPSRTANNSLLNRSHIFDRLIPHRVLYRTACKLRLPYS